MHKEKIYKSFDGTELFSVSDLTENMKAIVVILHGGAEHQARYDYLTKKFNEFDYGVYRFDNRGHGRSGGKRGFVDNFNDFIDDADLIVESIKEKKSRLPIFMLGHSMGGLTTCAYGIKFPLKLNGQILCGALVTEIPWFNDIMGIDVEKNEEMQLPCKLTSLIFRDKNVVKNAENDPLFLKYYTVKFYTSLLSGVRWVNKNIRKYNYPCLILHGGEDRIINKASSEYLYNEISSRDKSIKIYDGAYHEILNDFEKNAVISDIHNWIDNRIEKSEGEETCSTD